MTHSACPFCNPDAGAIFLETNKILGLWDAFPVSPGHALLVTKRHVADWFSATAIEQRELLAAIPKARDAITSEHCPAGFNVGFNVGEAAGQTVPHLHIHVIPRYPGDVPDPTGGVRHVIPGKANYLMSGDGSEYEARPLVRGGQSDPFMRRLRTDLEHCHTVDIAVAFIYEAGLDLIEDYLKDILRRDGRIRILTGDYRDVTDPKALHRLVDFRDSETRGSVELRIFECGEDSFHPKAYVLATKTGQSLAYVGSSNLSRMALEVGVEWNYRVSGETDPVGHQDIRDAFEELFLHPKTRTLNHQWIEDYRRRRTEPEGKSKVAIEAPREEPPEVPTPHSIQKEALAALEETRAAGNGAGLVVLATGLGKTWLSAFDSDRPEFKRILFVAHREEILDQAMRTFRKIRPTAHLGRFDGRAKDPNADVLFASVQALSRVANLRRFTRTSFDYVVIDEFHHAAARTYRKLIDYFDPKFLLGLTATPERTDGWDLLALCQENLVYRCDLAAGIGRELLSPFRYFGVPDLVDYSNIPWRSSRFDETELSNALATQARAENALEQYRLRGGERALGFCCSVRHADFMAVFFRDRGVRAVAVHSGDTSAPRARALDDLREGKLDMIFAVDIFNEGVDIPTVDTILMLRPTESRILWFQQFGRGLRKVAGKDHLTVVD
ncbi:MAG: DEAD/DEAH box helicase family protein, partial [Gemmatimonadota bacterium]|nr:DEAD/DEAH box helicase family protein [Gemmatimonadota bacterium]